MNEMIKYTTWNFTLKSVIVSTAIIGNMMLSWVDSHRYLMSRNDQQPTNMHKCVMWKPDTNKPKISSKSPPSMETPERYKNITGKKLWSGKDNDVLMDSCGEKHNLSSVLESWMTLTLGEVINN